MPSNADFTIDGDPFANGGYDASASASVDLQIEDSPALDVRTANYRVIAKSFGAGTIPELGDPGDPGASPSPNPQDILTITMPAGSGSWLIQCEINGGKDTTGATVPSFTKQRVIAVRTASGERHVVPSESTQYDATYGWTAAFAELVNGVEAVPSATVATAGAAAPAGQRKLITDEVIGFPVLAYSDGTDWRRVTDGAIIST